MIKLIGVVSQRVPLNKNKGVIIMEKITIGRLKLRKDTWLGEMPVLGAETTNKYVNGKSGSGLYV